jgi:hypothetical protein
MRRRSCPLAGAQSCAGGQQVRLPAAAGIMHGLQRGSYEWSAVGQLDKPDQP